MAAREVVIVGAGPAGLALAYLLARRGAGVTVLETHQDFARAFRGEGLQQSGLDAIRQLLVPGTPVFFPIGWELAVLNAAAQW